MIFTLLLAVSVIPAGQSFNCTPTAVYDGDGPIWCAEGPHIRLSGIAAREMALAAPAILALAQILARPVTSSSTCLANEQARARPATS